MAESDYIKIGDEYAEITSDAEGGVVLEIVELPPDMVPTPVPTPPNTLAKELCSCASLKYS